MKVGNINKTKQILDKYDFQIKKKYGQNFLIDENILNNIVKNANLSEKTGVIEIGPGLGSLTQIIALHAKKVLAYEIDEKLIPILKETLSEYDNVTILNEDILKADVNLDISNYLDSCSEIVVISNLPYYITTPILLTLLEQETPIKRYVVMMQKEVADRIASNPSIKDYNSLSIAIQYRARVKKVMQVPKTVFIPHPNVDSTVLRLETYNRDYKPKNESFFFDLVRSSFAQRRKTLVNNLQGRFGKEKTFYEEILKKLGMNPQVRSEALSLDDFIRLSDVLSIELEEDDTWDLYDENLNKLNITMRRGDRIPLGAYHLICHIIFRKDDKYLIQKRSFDKIAFPGMWATTGGGVLHGEESLSCAIRESKEELGIDLEAKDLKFCYNEIIKKGDSGHFNFVYLVDKDIKDDEVIIDHREVIDYKWASCDEIEEMERKGEFVTFDLARIKRIRDQKF